MRIIGLHSGHDCAYCVLEDGIPTIPFDKSDSIFTHVLTGQLAIESLHKNSWSRMVDQIHKNQGKFYGVGHHKAHAANAFFTSDYEESLIFTFDAGGWDIINNRENVSTTTVWRGVNNKLHEEKIYGFHELNIGGVWHGLLAPVFGLSNGPPKGNQAGTLMAMASIGDRDKYFKDIYSKFHPNALNYKEFKEIHDSYDNAKYDIAASLQKATEEIIKKLIQIHIKPSDKNLCFSGGVALNSVALGKVFEWFPQVENIFVPPAPYDAGLSIGAAQFVYHDVMNNPRIQNCNNASPYLGRSYGKDVIKQALDNDEDVEYNENMPIESLIKKLLDGNIVSVFAGGSESGRRALGNRSILADPRRSDMKDIINEKVKHRQWFRPFAPSILTEEVKNWFVKDVKSDYMSLVIPFKTEMKDKVPAVVHLDGTGRLQTVDEKMNKWYYNFIKKWHEASGVPIILNTSFNDREPIVETPTHAINCFKKTNIDNLYFVDAEIMVSKRNK